MKSGAVCYMALGYMSLTLQIGIAIHLLIYIIALFIAFLPQFSCFHVAISHRRRKIDKCGGGGVGGWTIFIYSCSQTLKTIDFKRN